MNFTARHCHCAAWILRLSHVDQPNRYCFLQSTVINLEDVEEEGKLLKNQKEGPETVEEGGKSREPKRKEGWGLTSELLYQHEEGG